MDLDKSLSTLKDIIIKGLFDKLLLLSICSFCGVIVFVPDQWLVWLQLDWFVAYTHFFAAVFYTSSLFLLFSLLWWLGRLYIPPYYAMWYAKYHIKRGIRKGIIIDKELGLLKYLVERPDEFFQEVPDIYAHSLDRLRKLGALTASFNLRATYVRVQPWLLQPNMVKVIKQAKG